MARLYKKARQARNYLLIISSVFVVMTALSIYLNVSKVKDQYEELAAHIGRSYFQTTIVTRRWNAEHVGVYVPIHDGLEPNPYLEDPQRDIVTTAGIRLTKINPAFMTRLTSELLAQEKGVHIHITSLKPINPRNVPDDWEKKVLADFDGGVVERYGIEGAGHSAVFRYMAPLKTEESCLICHRKHGYTVGDVRGGISVTFSYDPFLKAAGTQNRRIIQTHLFFLGVGLAVMYMLGRKMVSGITQLQESLVRIKTLEGILPICSHCKRMRIEKSDPRDQKSWVPFESYITEKTEAAFSHSICPSCAAELYPDIDLSKKDH